MGRYGRSSSYNSGRSSSGRSGRSSGGRSYSSSQAHQHVGQSKYGYTKTYTPGTGYRMRKD